MLAVAHIFPGHFASGTNGVAKIARRFESQAKPSYPLGRATASFQTVRPRLSVLLPIVFGLRIGRVYDELVDGLFHSPISKISIVHVIPAKAGIYCHWIPACAGMT